MNGGESSSDVCTESVCITKVRYSENNATFVLTSVLQTLMLQDNTTKLCTHKKLLLNQINELYRIY